MPKSSSMQAREAELVLANEIEVRQMVEGRVFKARSYGKRPGKALQMQGTA